jgi:adenylate kinase
MLRAAVKAGTPLGLAAKKVMDAGRARVRRHHHRPRQGSADGPRLRGRLPFRRLSRARFRRPRRMRDARRRHRLRARNRRAGQRDHRANERPPRASGARPAPITCAFNPPKLEGKDDEHRARPSSSATTTARRPCRNRLAVYHAQTEPLIADAPTGRRPATHARRNAARSTGSAMSTASESRVASLSN